VLGTSRLWRSTVAFTYLYVKSAKCLCLLILVVRQIDVFSCLLLTCFAVFCTFCFTFRLCCIILSFCFTRKMAFVRLNKPYDDLKNLVFITAADSLSVVSNTVIMAGVGCCGVWWNWRSDNNAALECFKVLCEHGGECVNTATDYTCTCQPGFGGDRCQNGKQSQQRLIQRRFTYKSGRLLYHTHTANSAPYRFAKADRVSRRLSHCRSVCLSVSG